MTQTAPPSGMRDFLPAELCRRKFVEKIIREVFESYGFVPIETPAIENLATLLGKYGEEGDQLLYRILHRRDKLTRVLEGGKPTEKDLAELGLRYDLTVPLARVIANNRNLPKFFKRYQIQPVWRADRPGKGRFREFVQCDVDIIGTDSLIAETEVCGAVSRAILTLGFTDFFIHLNHRQLLKCLIGAAGIPDENEETALIAVDKLDKIGEEGVAKELENRGIGSQQAIKLLEIFRREAGSTEEDEISRLENILAGIEAAKKPIQDLREILNISKGNFFEKYLRIDTSLARGLGYYTGPIFEIRASEVKGSLGGGGRYDGLIGMFCDRHIPAVGFSIGFERLIMLMEEKELFPSLSVGPHVLLCRFPEVPAAEMLQIADRIRKAGFKVEVFPETPKMGKQLAYADSIAVPVVAIVGSDELAAGTITLKKLATAEQVNVSLVELPKILAAWVFPRS